jgi:cytochrome P450
MKNYIKFSTDSVTERIALQKAQAHKPEEDRRQDMFYFLYEARNPDTGLPAFSENDLRAESNVLIVAGFDTTSTVLAGIFFYLSGDPRRYQKLTDEIRTTFDSVDDIIYGPKLLSCTYLKSCIDEGLRMVPPGGGELPRTVLKGGIRIMGEFYPEGTNVGVPAWAKSRSQEEYGDPEVFRPERWIVDEASGVTKESVNNIRSGFHPFIIGPTTCPGKNLAMMEMMIVLARILYRFDMRRAPGSTVGGGDPSLGWGRRDKNQYHFKEAWLAIRCGPEVQFRERAV